MELMNSNQKIDQNIRATLRNRLLERLTKVDNQIVPTIEINPIPNVVLDRFATGGSATSAATVTLITTPATGGDFYLFGVNFSYVKDATCDVSDGNISITFVQNSVTQNLVRCAINTLTAQDQMINLALPAPIRLDRNTSVQITAPTFTAGKFNRHATLFGLFVPD